jgi:Tripartite ATP-independent periplasmic transporters, DctQ component
MAAGTATPRAERTGGDFPAVFYGVIRVIDGFTDITGKLISLTMALLVAIITYEVFARYLFNAPTVWVYESSYMINGTAFMLGCAYALLKGAHVRTDIFWERYSERALAGEHVARHHVAVSRSHPARRAAVHDPGRL